VYIKTTATPQKVAPIAKSLSKFAIEMFNWKWQRRAAINIQYIQPSVTIELINLIEIFGH